MTRVRTELGFVEVELYVGPRTQARKRVSVVGVGGVQVVPDLTLDPEFDHHPWNSDQVQGEIRFPAIRQITGRRGVQRDRRVYPLFAAAVQSIEADLAARVERFNQEQESQTDSRLSRAAQTRRTPGARQGRRRRRRRPHPPVAGRDPQLPFRRLRKLEPQEPVQRGPPDHRNQQHPPRLPARPPARPPGLPGLPCSPRGQGACLAQLPGDRSGRTDGEIRGTPRAGSATPSETRLTRHPRPTWGPGARCWPA